MASLGTAGQLPTLSRAMGSSASGRVTVERMQGRGGVEWHLMTNVPEVQRVLGKTHAVKPKSK